MLPGGLTPRNFPVRIEAGKLLLDLPPHSAVTVVVEIGEYYSCRARSPEGAGGFNPLKMSKTCGPLGPGM
jgi:hypothetical protein